MAETSILQLPKWSFGQSGGDERAPARVGSKKITHRLFKKASLRKGKSACEGETVSKDQASFERDIEESLDFSTSSENDDDHSDYQSDSSSSTESDEAGSVLQLYETRDLQQHKFDSDGSAGERELAGGSGRGNRWMAAIRGMNSWRSESTKASESVETAPSLSKEEIIRNLRTHSSEESSYSSRSTLSRTSFHSSVSSESTRDDDGHYKGLRLPPSPTESYYSKQGYEVALIEDIHVTTVPKKRAKKKKSKDQPQQSRKSKKKWKGLPIFQKKHDLLSTAKARSSLNESSGRLSSPEQNSEEENSEASRLSREQRNDMEDLLKTQEKMLEAKKSRDVQEQTRLPKNKTRGRSLIKNVKKKESRARPRIKSSQKREPRLGGAIKSPEGRKSLSRLRSRSPIKALRRREKKHKPKPPIKTPKRDGVKAKKSKTVARVTTGAAVTAGAAALLSKHAKESNRITQESKLKRRNISSAAKSKQNKATAKSPAKQLLFGRPTLSTKTKPAKSANKTAMRTRRVSPRGISSMNKVETHDETKETGQLKSIATSETAEPQTSSGNEERSPDVASTSNDVEAVVRNDGETNESKGNNDGSANENKRIGIISKIFSKRKDKGDTRQEARDADESIRAPEEDDEKETGNVRDSAEEIRDANEEKVSNGTSALGALIASTATLLSFGDRGDSVHANEGQDSPTTPDVDVAESKGTISPNKGEKDTAKLRKMVTKIQAEKLMNQRSPSLSPTRTRSSGTGIDTEVAGKRLNGLFRGKKSNWSKKDERRMLKAMDHAVRARLLALESAENENVLVEDKKDVMTGTSYCACGAW